MRFLIIILQTILFSLAVNASTFTGQIQRLVPDEEGLKVIVSIKDDSHSKGDHTDLFYLENLNRNYEKIYSHLETCQEKHENVSLILEKKANSAILIIKDLK